MKISVSILNAKDKKETIKILNNTDISYFHIDVMDGNFVKQISIPVEETLALSKVSEKKLDIHLMHSRPLSYIEQIKDLKYWIYNNSFRNRREYSKYIKQNKRIWF